MILVCEMRFLLDERCSVRDNETACSSLLRRSSHFGYEGWKLRGIL
jgi:hypothetical protein